MLALLWLRGLVTRRGSRLLGAMAGVALTVALLDSLGTFIASSAATMTERAIADVPVDWQVQLVPGSDPRAITAALGKATAYSAIEQVGFASVAGFSATTGGTVQTTGSGAVLGWSSAYRRTFPAEVRPLIGAADGTLIAQQTASNLHVSVGDTVAIQRPGLPPVTVRIDGVVDLPQADSLFQAVGVPAGAAPQAPPDNVLILPGARWHELFDPQVAARPGTIRTQLHVRLPHALPPDPNAAFVYVQRLANNFEARIAGSGLVGDNLAARLGGVREDALYARVLFLFLGLPGAVLAVLLTFAIASAGAGRRRQEQALLRTRGASTARVLRLAGVEALAVGIGGAGFGVGLALIAEQLAGVHRPPGWSAATWTAGAASAGVLLATAAVLYPAWAQARNTTVATSRVVVGRGSTPLWQRLYIDLILLVAAAAMFWRTASTGYQVVLAPEGVAQTSVSYESLIAPVCLWLGAALVAVRLCRAGLASGGRGLAQVIRPIARGLAGVVAAWLGRQRVLVTRGIVLVALAVSFATSTAIFNTTYNAQSHVDAELTNGADVTASGSSATPAGGKLADLRALPGVAAVQPMQHRFAYVGSDLQDMYGIDPRNIATATNISNAYFADGNAQASLAALAAHPDGVLVSAETVKDFQLNPGDLLNLRLQNPRDHQYHVVPFHFIGVVREFPTAPRDSFLVANASYVARQTGSDAAEIVLLRASGNPADLAARVRDVMRPLAGIKVSDIGSTQQVISSSLTAVDLQGLTRLELAFAVLLAVGATGLMMALGLADRRRTFALLAALGAKRDQLGAFLWSEGLLILLGGALIGIALGYGVAQMLVKLLTGIFDPPPEALAVPWTYLAVMVIVAAASGIAAVIGGRRAAQENVLETLREL